MTDFERANTVEMLKHRDEMLSRAKSCRKFARRCFWLSLCYFPWNRTAYRKCREFRRDALQAALLWESGISVLNQHEGMKVRPMA